MQTFIVLYFIATYTTGMPKLKRRGEHQLHFIETFRDAETKVVGCESRVGFDENHMIQSDTKI